MTPTDQAPLNKEVLERALGKPALEAVFALSQIEAMKLQMESMALRMVQLQEEASKVPGLQEKVETLTQELEALRR